MHHSCGHFTVMCKGILTFFHIQDDQPSHLKRQSSKSFSGLLQNEMNRQWLSQAAELPGRCLIVNWLDNTNCREINDDRVGDLEIDTIKVHWEN